MKFDPTELLQSIELDQLEALVEVMYLAADADGEFSASERAELASSIQALARGTQHESALGSEQLGPMLDRVGQALAAEGREGRLAAVREKLADPAARKAAFGLSVKVTAADGIVRTSEREFILDLAEALSVDRDEAADLVRELTAG